MEEGTRPLGTRSPPARQAASVASASARYAARTVRTRTCLDRGQRAWSSSTVPEVEILSTFLTRLVGAPSFEGAGRALLEATFERVDAALAGGPYVSLGRILRGVIHLRPDGSYQRLFGLERATGLKVEGTGYVTSGNVWSWIEDHRCSVSIDLRRGSMKSWLPDGPLVRRESNDDGFPGNATRDRMLGRDATHVHVVPIRAAGGAVAGVLTLEASCQVATTDEFVWADCYEDLEVLVNVAGAFLTRHVSTSPSSPPADDDEFLPVVGTKTAHLIELLGAFAAREDTILISGPTGSGKSRLGRWCHEHSSRKGEAFEVLDLIGVPEDLQMAELFGWKRGAFTGAVKDNPGAISRAEKGTLFIDEIDKLSMRAQAGLLRFIEERLYRMLGDDTSATRRADVRLLVGTNADLKAAVRAGRFREDLFYRINVLPVRLPPLAERLDELPKWAGFMLRRCHAESGGGGDVMFDPDAIARLTSMPWPGNLRQLDNIVRRSYALFVNGAGQGPGDRIVGAKHVERAFLFDGDDDSEQSAVAGLLMRAAHAFVREATRRRGTEAPLSLEMAEAFRSMVLGVAVQQLGNREDAFHLFGQHQLVKGRNHHRTLRRELLRMREVLTTLGGALDGDLGALLDSDDRSLLNDTETK